MQHNSELDSLLEARKPVWFALSNLFLNSEFKDDVSTIAHVLAVSPYSLAELDAILRYEVTPILRLNLSIYAWPGDAFDEVWMVKKMTPRINRQPWLSLGLPKVIRADWQQVLAHLQRYRQPAANL